MSVNAGTEEARTDRKTDEKNEKKDVGLNTINSVATLGLVFVLQLMING